MNESVADADWCVFNDESGFPGGFQGGRKPYYQTDEFKGRWDPDPYHIG